MTVYLSYRDAATCRGTNSEAGYVRETVTDTSRMAREVVLPGQQGFPDLHVTHLQDSPAEADALFIIALTSHALSQDDRARILEGGHAFLQAPPQAQDMPRFSSPVGRTGSGRSIYPPPSENPLCKCSNPIASMFCSTGHMLECHWPQTCREADCSHMDRYEGTE